MSDFDSGDWNRWRGSVDAYLKTMDIRVIKLMSTVEEMPEEIVQKIEKMLAENQKEQIDFKWLTEKILLPFAVSAVSAGGVLYVILKNMTP
jgi:flagellar biosynthesis chaperone FliJ